jgi:hypothetical protein
VLGDTRFVSSSCCSGIFTLLTTPSSIDNIRTLPALPRNPLKNCAAFPCRPMPFSWMQSRIILSVYSGS